MNVDVCASPLNVLEGCYFFRGRYVFSSSFRDSRFNVPRGALPLDEQHRLQQYNQISSGRNLQQPTPGAISGHRMVPGGKAMGISGVNRGTPMSRPAFQGIGSLPNTGNIHSGGGASKGNSMPRPPREAAQHMMRVSYLALVCCYVN